MSLFKPNTMSFSEQIKQNTEKSKIYSVSIKANAIEFVNKIIKDHIDKLMDDLAIVAMSKIKISSNAGMNSVIIFKNCQGDNMIVAEGNDEQDFKRKIANKPLDDFVSNSTKRVVNIEYKSYLFNNNDVCNMPTMNDLVEYLKNHKHLKDFNITIADYINSKYKTGNIICVSW